MMNENTKKVIDLLMAPHRKKQEILRLETVIQELYDCLLPGAIRYDSEKVQTSPKNKQEETIVKIESLEDDLQKLKEERAEMIIAVNDAIENHVEDPVQKAVLIYYYVNRLNPDNVARRIGYGRRWMYKIKNDAIEKLISEMHI